MIKAARFSINHDGFTALAGYDFTEKGWKNFDLQRHAARRTGRKLRLVEDAFHQPRLALGTLNQRIVHPSFVNDRVLQI